MRSGAQVGFGAGEDRTHRRSAGLGGVGVACSFIAGISGCADSVSLSDERGELTLEYRCPPAASHLRVTGAPALLRDYAIRIIRAEHEQGRLEELTALRRAYDDADLATLEREVIAYLCQRGVPVAESELDREPTFPEPGSEAPAIALPILLEDGAVGDSVLRIPTDETAVLLYFFGSWCTPCVRRFPDMRDLAARMSNSEVGIYGVTHYEAPWRTAEWLADHGGIPFPFLVDREGAAARTFRIRGIPAMFLLASDGTVIDRCLGCQAGSMSPESLPELLGRVAAGVHDGTP